MDLPLNPDLAWDLDDFSQQERATEFVMRFETTLCVYSPSVAQLYTNYNICFPQEWQRKLVILPNPGAFHDTYQNVDISAVARTGLLIIPGELVGKEGLFLTNGKADANGDRQLGGKQVPFEAGMRAIMKKREGEDPFLPVLIKGDLREFEQSWPVLHMHRLRLPMLGNLSELDRSSIHNVVNEKLESLFLELSRDQHALAS